MENNDPNIESDDGIIDLDKEDDNVINEAIEEKELENSTSLMMESLSDEKLEEVESIDSAKDSFSEEDDDDPLYDSSEDSEFTDFGELSSNAGIESNDKVISEVEGHGNASIINSTIQIGSSEDEDTSYPCPNCNVQIDASKYGKITCDNCGFNIYRRNLKLNINQFETIEDNEVASNYHNIIARVNNNFIRKRYPLAFKFCVEAEKLAPREPSTWEYFALIDFFYQMTMPKDKRKDIKHIIKDLRVNLKLCDANGVEDEKVEEIKGQIANYLFNSAKSKIGNFFSKSQNKKGYWSRYGRKGTINSLRVIEECYRLTKDTIYLKGFVEELSKPYKWIVKNRLGILIKLPACGKNFKAIKERERVINLIKRVEIEYEEPKIASERFIIDMVEEKPKENPGINIISIE